jgi:predicted nucleic acid-binding protein
MSVERFIDTNLFIYQLEALDEHKAATAERIIRQGVETGDACISFQVVQECLNTVLRKARIPLTTQQTRLYLETVLAPLFRVPASIALYQRGLDIQARYRYGFYDAMIIAAALDAGCTRLLSEDLRHGQRIEALTIENPFQD